MTVSLHHREVNTVSQRARDRKMTVLQILSCGFAISFLIACCHGKTIVLTNTDKDKSVVIGRRDTVIVKLPVTPTTGYMWHLRSAQAVLVQVGSSEFEPLEPWSGKLGADEVQVFRFVAQRAGHEELKFTYGRQLEALKQISFTITVR
jgi:predicted secreted protein